MAFSLDLERHNSDCVPEKNLLISYYHGACKEPLCGLTIPQLVEAAASGCPTRILYRVLEYNQTITAKQLLEQANSFSKGLISQGVLKGDVVFCVGLDTIDFYPIMHAVFAIGAVFFNDVLCAPKAVDLARLIDIVKPKLLICGEKEISTVEEVIGNSPERNWDCFCVSFSTNSAANVCSHKELLKNGETVPDEQLQSSKRHISLDDNAWIVASSGTTGQPKLMYVGHHALVNFAKFTIIRKNPQRKPQVEAWLNTSSDDVMPVTQALAILFHWRLDHVGIMLPSTVDYTEEGVQRLKEIIEQEKITTISLMPFWMVRLVEEAAASPYNLSSLRSGLLVSQGVSQEVRRKIAEEYSDSVVAFGATEFLTATTTSPDMTTKEQFMTSAGYAMPHVEVKVVSDDGDILPINTTGELCFRGWPLCNGYHSSSVNTQKVVDARNWFHSGDLGRMDPTGHVEILGRKSDSIRFKKKGEVVYPEVVEAAVRQHEKVRDVKVIGLSGDKFGTTIVACVILRRRTVASSEDIKAFLSTKVLENARPDHVLFFDEFPKVGARKKVSRSQLTELVKMRIVPEI
ncbi:medium-chain acyl-CoA ligase ACSF2, mitochondrial-like [Haliotis rubra]|uniref:medium-chain acyl-CoA ligase ACSF2, mitochondrial-like n=1 Tax=Haliotis rubra TaxID=36100 RepID=UPI001EE52EE2|nr:medium-chain acyl-CoA ligase ACSF2, mitochondrial-like [Haliotis rubra]